METPISLSILEYEPELSEKMDRLESSEAFMKIVKLIQTGKIRDVHVDVMRPPMIPGKNKFSTSLIKKLYEKLSDKVALTIHLMVSYPFEIIEEINRFIEPIDRAKITLILQVESFVSEDEALEAIELLKGYGYKVGVCLNLPTSEDRLTDNIANSADIILLMTVPMGLGGQKYREEATQRIKKFSARFPNKIIEVDGGIDPKTIVKVWRAGARVFVIGSYITLSEKPEEALLNLEKSLKMCSEAYS
ncbi:MAG: hypothetical protein QXK89_01280 [Candidatus Bathyarchaeia archaeon]|nr:hypothetical protein [Candidatus Bathyarchaeota archaeon]